MVRWLLTDFRLGDLLLTVLFLAARFLCVFVATADWPTKIWTLRRSDRMEESDRLTTGMLLHVQGVSGQLQHNGAWFNHYIQ